MSLPGADSTSEVEPLEPVIKKFKVREQHVERAKSISEKHDISQVASKVLAARGFDAGEELSKFLKPTLKDGLPPPDQLLGLNQAAKLLVETLNCGESIAICCDFDVDGLSGGSQVCHFLSKLGAKVKVFVPDRFSDGYGLSDKMVREVADGGYSVMLTIDFGTTNVSELELARSLGLKTIVVDHHHVVNPPPSDVFVNPANPKCGFAGGILCASGLSWYLLIGIRNVLDRSDLPDVRDYLDLACLGTICDMVPLIGANRVIARRGLEKLTSTERVGLKALKSLAGINGNIACHHIGFGIGPRLNAAGRMIHGDLVIELLTTSDSVKARQIAGRLEKLNSKRQTIEAHTKLLADKQYRLNPRSSSAIVVWDPEFHTGVIGLVAQRLVENYYRPAAVMGADRPGVFKGSVRGIAGFSVVGALHAVSKHLLKFGGHDGAGGFSVAQEKVVDFARAFELECESRLRDLDLNPTVVCDTEVRLDELSFELLNELKSFAPFGIGNPGPVLLARNLRVLESKSLKGLHLRVTLGDGKQTIAGLMWRQRFHPALQAGNIVAVAFKPELNQYQGTCRIQANLQAAQLESS